MADIASTFLTAKPSIVITQKQVFGPHTAKSQPIW